MDIRKISKYQFNENLFSGSRVVPCGRTDRHEEGNSHFPKFCERKKKPINIQILEGHTERSKKSKNSYIT